MPVQDTSVDATLTCNICGASWYCPEDAKDFNMMHHMLFCHPMELISHPRVQKGIIGICEDLGGRLADSLRGKNGKS